MRNNITKFPLLFSFFAMLLLISAGGIKNVSAQDAPDYSGSWDLYFYDASGKVEGAKTIDISEDGSISDKANLNIDNINYLTEISAVIAAGGKLKEGTLTDNYKLERVGALTGTFTENEGSGDWKNYQGKSGTWKAKRSDKKTKH